MRAYTIHIALGSGVILKLEAYLEHKHYTEQEMDARLRKLAESLDGTYLYKEAQENQNVNQ